MKLFLIQLFSIGAIIAIGIAAWNTYGPNDLQLNALWFILVFFIGITAIIHYILLRSEGKRVGSFVNNFMGATAGKLFLYLFIILLYSITHRSEAKVFIMGFLFHYLVFTVFEVVALLKHFRQIKSAESVQH